MGTLQHAAIRRQRPGEIYALLRLAPVGVALVGIGALLTLGLGIALAGHEGLGFDAAGVLPAASYAIELMLVVAILAFMVWQPT